MMTLVNPGYPQPAGAVGHSAPSDATQGAPRYLLGFILFVLVNAALFMRPTEMFPEYFYAQTYLVLILSCFIVSIPCVWKQLSARALAAQPISLCVLGLTAAIMLSHLTRFAVEDAFISGWEFAKIALYFLLLIGLLNTSGRLRQFLFWLVIFMLGQTLAAVLEFHGVTQNPNFETLREEKSVTAVLRRIDFYYRLCGSGIFHNPNEICYPIGMAMMVCLYYLGSRQTLLLRAFCLAALVFFGYAVSLTLSRGGFIGIAIGFLGFLLARFGWRKAVPFAAVFLVAFFVLLGGRQTDIAVSEGTGQTRIQLWNDGLVAFLKVPFFGLGTGLFREETGYVAHNSFIQAYSELGFFGGTLFVGAFYLCLLSLYRLGLCQEQINDPELRRLRPYLIGLVSGFIGCMMTMSLTDMIPTYTVPALVVAYLGVTTIRPPLPNLPRFDSRLVLRLATVSALTLVFFRLYVWFTFVVG